MSFTQDLGFEDAFGKLIADNTSNVLSIPSHFPFNAERLRLFVNGSRAFQQYSNQAQYNFNGSVHQLFPGSGENVTLESARRPSYQVHNEFEASFAFSINQPLNIGDQVRVGLYDDTDGWFLERNGNHGTNEVDLVIRESGSEAIRETKTLSINPVGTFTRFLLRTSWYRIGAAKWQQFFTQNGEEFNEEIGSISIDNEGGPRQANLPLRFEANASTGTSGLQVNAGSVSHVLLGDAAFGGNARTKRFFFDDDVQTTGTWVPVRAFRHVNRERGRVFPL